MTVDNFAEELVRAIDRRTFLRRTAGAVIGVVTTFSLFGTEAAWASHCPPDGFVQSCDCGPLNGLYCTSIDPSMCSGSSCTTNVCTYNFDEWSDACWCTKCCSGIYYHCCDCNCPVEGGGEVQCGCKSQRTC